MSRQIEQTDVPSRIARRATNVHQSEPDNSGPDAPGHGLEHDVSGRPYDRLSGCIDNQPVTARIGLSTSSLLTIGASRRPIMVVNSTKYG
jgi:hypothetical protein